MVAALGLAAAVMLAIGFVLQQHEASRSNAEPLHPTMLLRLARRPVWLGGIGAMVAGQLLGASALGTGSIVVVEPLLATNVLFALPLSALWQRRHPGLREWVGAVILIGGLLTFLGGGSPSTQVSDTPIRPLAWIGAFAGIAVLVLGLLHLARGRDADLRATLTAGAAGLLFAMQDVLTQRTLLSLSHGILSALTSWHPWVLITVAIAGLTLSQSAFEIAALPASLPALTLAEPVGGIALGVLLLGQRLQTGPVALVLAVVGLVMMGGGVWVVSRSHVVAFHHHHPHLPHPHLHGKGAPPPGG